MAAQLHIIGGGLAGSEAAWQAAESGIAVILHEMRPVRGTEAHQTDSLAELVCSNSFRSDDAANNAVGLLHEEMRRAGSLIMRAADACKLPAGGALAVDRHAFSAAVSKALENHPGVSLSREEIQLIRDFIKPAPGSGTAIPTINVGDSLGAETIPLPSQLMEKIPKLLGGRFTTRNGSIIILRRDSRNADIVLPPN